MNKKTVSRRIKVIFTVLIIVISIFSYFAYGYYRLHEATVKCELNLEQINKLTGLSFSNETRVIHSFFEEWQDAHFYAVLESKSSKIDGLFANTNYEISTSNRYLSNSTERGCAWFTPDSLVKFKSFSFDNNMERTRLDVLYDDSIAETKLIYISWFEY